MAHEISRSMAVWGLVDMWTLQMVYNVNNEKGPTQIPQTVPPSILNMALNKMYINPTNKLIRTLP